MFSERSTFEVILVSIFLISVVQAMVVGQLSQVPLALLQPTINVGVLAGTSGVDRDLRVAAAARIRSHITASQPARPAHSTM